MINYSILGKNITTKREEFGLTQEEVARHLDVTTTYLQKIEAGKKQPSLNLIENIADFFKVDFYALIAEPEEVESMFADIDPFIYEKIKDNISL